MKDIQRWLNIKTKMQQYNFLEEQYYNFLLELLKEKKYHSKGITKGVKNRDDFKALFRGEVIALEKTKNGGFNYVIKREDELKKYFESRFPNPIYKPKDSASKYRETAMANKEKKCERCGYYKYPDILEVHHKDRDRNNGSPENLEILCPNCHTEEHHFKNDGRFNKRKIKTQQ